MDLRVGDRIHVRTLSGAISERVVAGYSDEGDLLVCTVREYEAAQQEGREPRGIGWPAEHILEPVTA